MKKRIISMLLALVMVFTLCPAAVHAEETPVTVTIPGTEHYTYAAEVFSLVNGARTDSGLDALTRNATLTELAMQRAAEIAVYYHSSHLRPDDTACSTIVDGVYTGWTNFGENIAIGQGDPTAVMEDWMNSDGHRGNILDTDYTQIGIGCFYTDGTYCWVQIFSDSTTNTATTATTGAVVTTRDISILPANLALEPAGTSSLELEEGETMTLSITTTNPGFEYIAPALILPDAECTREDGTVIATGTCDSSGEFTITAVAPGSGTMSIPAYAGQSDPLTIQVTVPGEIETEPTETEHVHSYSAKVTSPTCTQPGYTTYTCDCGDSYRGDDTNALGHSYEEGTCSRCGEKDPDYVEPTEPEPSEPEPTEPEPSEPDDPDSIASGICGDDLSWNLDADGILTIRGAGAMEDYTYGGSPWYSFREEILAVVVESGVTTIGDYAFANLEALANIQLPDTLVSLGEYTFYWCESLTTLDLPDSLTVLPHGLFQASGLEILEIPDSITTLDNQVFYACSGLEYVLIPDSVMEFGDSIFANCRNVTIYTYDLSCAHLYAEGNEIPVVILEEEPDTVFYNIHYVANDGGQVSVIPESSPANRFVFLEVAPSDGYYVKSIYYYCNTVLDYEKVSDTVFAFFMPAEDVYFEITFMLDENPFTDVPSTAYYYEPVMWAVSKGITSGISENRFGPGNACTRAQVVTFLWRTMNSPEPTTTVNPFTDVKETDYYYKAVLWAVENGITSGISADKFGPKNVCTRAQVVTFLWRAAQSPTPQTTINPFADVAENSYYYQAVLWAVENGITSGVSETTFGSGNTCTRAHVVTFLYKAANPQ